MSGAVEPSPPGGKLDPASTPPQGLPAPRTPPPGGGPIPVDLLRQFMVIQEKQLSVQQAELEVRARVDTNDHDYSTKALAAHSEDRQRERTFRGQQSALLAKFGAFALLAILLFMAYTVYAGKDEIAKDLVKSVILIAAGGLGGWGARGLKDGGVKKPAKGRDSDDDE